MDTDGSLCDEMRARSADIWQSLHAHPFLREIADGTLPLDKFRFFLEQDDFYLIDYARCLAMGAAKSADESELRYFTVDLNQVLDLELPSNRALIARVTQMGAADHGGALGMAPANVAYTSYMQSLALRGGTMEIMAALLPCAWSYVEIAQTLVDDGASSHEVFGDWISYFTLPATVEMVASMRKAFDHRAIIGGLDPAAREALGEIFAMSSRLERGFWEMAYTFEQWPDLGTS
jgi:thiaminase/transcriptional activator TenA